jgi:hypothetical protein
MYSKRPPHQPAISIPYFIEVKQEKVDDPPKSKTAKGKKFEACKDRLAQIKAVDAEYAKEEGQQEDNPPVLVAVAGLPA